MTGRLIRHDGAADLPPSATYEFTLRLRCDVHAFRKVPYGPSTFPGNGAGTGLGSTCRLVSASGIQTSVDDPTLTSEWRLTNPAGLDLPLVFDRPSNHDHPHFRGGIYFYPDGMIDFNFELSARDGVTIVSRSQGEVIDETKFNAAARVTISAQGFNPKTYAIEAGTGTAPNEIATLVWGGAVASSPPDPKVPGYAE